MSMKTYDEAQIAAARAKQQGAPLDSESHDVAVALSGDSYLIRFPFSPTLQKQLKAATSAAWDKEAKAWMVPAAEYDAVADAVEKLRATAQAMSASKEALKASVAAAMPDAKISNARTLEGTRTNGAILALNEHYVAQANGKNYVAVHERASLAKTDDVGLDQIAVGRDLSVYYRKGAGLMWNRVAAKERESSPAKEAAQSRSASPSHSHGDVKSRSRRARAPEDQSASPAP